MSVRVSDRDSLYRHCTEVWGNGDITLARQLYSPDIVDLNPAPGQRPGPNGLIDVISAFHAAMSDVSIEVLDIVPLGNDRWLDRWTMRGNHTGEIMGFKPTGRDLEFSGVDIVSFRNGLIVSQWHVEEILRLLMQIGLTLPLPAQALAHTMQDRK